MLRRETVKSGLRNSIHAKNKTGVLNRAVRIDQSRADCANLGPLHMLSHDCEPIGLDRFDASVQKQQPRAVGLLHRIIFGCGIIRRIWEMQHLRKSAARLVDFVALAHLNDHNFVIRIACFADQVFDDIARATPGRGNSE